MGADIVLAVDIASYDDNSFWQTMGQRRFILGTVGRLIVVLGESLDIIMRQQRAYKLQEAPPDFMLQLSIPQDVTVMTGYHRAAEVIALGETATHPIVPDLQYALLSKAG